MYCIQILFPSKVLKKCNITGPQLSDESRYHRNCQSHERVISACTETTWKQMVKIILSRFVLFLFVFLLLSDGKKLIMNKQLKNGRLQNY